jgi:hypothetical protein
MAGLQQQLREDPWRFEPDAALAILGEFRRARFGLAAHILE